MSEFSHSDDPMAAIDAQLERLVDVENISYDDARRKLGLPSPDYADFSADAIQSRLGPAALGEFDGDSVLDLDVTEPHDGSNPKHGLNHRSWDKVAQDPTELERIQRGVALGRQAMRGDKKED